MTQKQKAKIEIPKVLEKLKLRDCSVIFFNAVDEGFGTTITINATDQSLQDKISAWVKANSIGKDKPGIANFKKYQPEDSDEVTIQYSFKITDFTKYVGVDGLTKDDIGYGSIIDIIANPFAYKNKFGEGVSASLSAVLVREKGKTGSDADMEDLMADIEVKPEESIEPINAFGN